MAARPFRRAFGKPSARDLLINILDQTVNTEPDALYAMWPVNQASYDAGFRAITYSQLANMVNGLAWWLDDVLGKDSKTVFAYMGPNDARTPALGLAGVKTGNSLFVTSPRNSIEAQAHLFSSLMCTTLITPMPIPSPARPVIEALSPRHSVIPSIDELLHETYPHYEYSRSLKEGLSDPLMIIHTSGSTGLPKPLIWTQDTVFRHQNASMTALVSERLSLDKIYVGKRIMSTLPLFHGAGLGQTWLYAIPFRNTIISPAAVAIVTAQGLVDALKQTPADIALLVPSVVAELAESPGLLRYCSEHLEMIVYIGGDLPQQTGDKVAAVMPLRCQWGASEVGMPPQLMAPELDPRTDWKYVRFHPSAGIVMEKVGDDLFELVIRRDKALADTQTTFTISGKQDLDEYRTRDLFSPHPTIPNEWAWKARADDIIVFLNGEKTNPITMEQHVVTNNPGLISGVIVVGAQRFQAALLIEPLSGRKTTAEQAALVEEVWPSIEEANRAAPAHARIEKSLVLVTKPNRPLIRAGKGTLQRGVSIAQYENEINALYENIGMAEVLDHESRQEGDIRIDPSSAGKDVIDRHIHRSVLEITKWPLLEHDQSFFELGMDSLQALRLMRILRRMLGRPDLDLSTIYLSPTVSKLTRTLVEGPDSEPGRSISNYDTEMETMASLLATYRQLVREIPLSGNMQMQSSPQKPIHVILTGSTGTLGSMILRSLLKRESIGHIFCLNRRAVPRDDGTPSESRVTFLPADLARPDFGLGKNGYQVLQNHVSLIIHCAWPVNFNLALSTFRPQLVAMLNLFTFASAAHHRPQIHFISSIGAVAGASTTSPIPETVISSLETASSNGYARSKLVSELLCEEAARHLGVPVRIARVGQIAGPSDNFTRDVSTWSSAEWLPSLVVSSMNMGCIPGDLGPRFSLVDWTPSDLTAEVIVDLATSETSSTYHDGAKVFNVRNPNTTTWQALLPVVRKISVEKFGRVLDVVPSSTWLEHLGRSERRDSGYAEGDMALSIKAHPALRLLNFYREELWKEGPDGEPMSIKSALAASSNLRNMPGVQEDWMRRWIEGWLA